MNLVIPSIFTAVDKFSAPVNKMSGALKTLATNADIVETKFNAINNTASNIASKSLLLGAALGAPLLVAVNEAVKFEDRLADVAKTTGLSGKALDAYGEAILDIATKTRTSIPDLQKIGEIGGQLGVATNELVAFTKASNEFSVALGADYGSTEIAITQVGKLNKLFKDTRDLDISTSITKAGSVLNELGAMGAGTTANINDFMLRIGALPDALKPTSTAAAALGTYLEELGINAEIGAGGLTKVLLDAGKSLPAFAKQMGITAEQAKVLLSTDATGFVTKLASSFKGVAPDVLAKKLRALGIDSQESIKVLGALGSNTERLTKLQGAASDAFEKANSLHFEYAKKNDTTAAKMKIAANNAQVLAIVVGTELLPVLGALINRVTPIIKSVVDWVREHKGLTKVIIGTVAAVSGLLIAMGGFAAIVSTITGFIAAVAAAAPAFLFIAGIVANYLVPALQVALATITVIAEMIAGALGVSVGVVAVGFALIVSLVASLWRNWDMIVKSFRDGGIIAGIKAIGVAILDSVLAPLQYVLSLIAKITGADWAKNAASGIEKFRTDLGVDMNGDTAVTPAVNPKKVEQDAMVSRTESTQKQNVSIDINDNTGRANVSSSNEMIPITTTRTLGSGLNN